MPIASDTLFHLPSYSSSTAQKGTPIPDRLDYSSDDGLDVDIFNQDMAGSTSPFIKDEPFEMSFNSRFASNNGFDMEHQYSGQQFGQSPNSGSVNPSELQMSGSGMNNFSSHMSSSYIMGQANIGDDELLDLGNLDDPNPHFSNFNEQQRNQHFIPNNGGPVSMTYSHTPEGAPIQSPFASGSFNYGHFQSSQRPGHHLGVATQGANMNNTAFARPRMPSNLDRKPSDSRSPMTPSKGFGELHIGTPGSSSVSSHAHPFMGHRPTHQRAQSQVEHVTPGSAGSYLDSPLQSPYGVSMGHPQPLQEVMSGKHSSLPNKVEGNSAYQSQEAKRKKRRESHNAVERRRRDNINERIHDLSRLVPTHRLEDEKVRKHIHNNGPLSPTIAASGISPPHATSLLAGGTGRRAAGNITTGLPLEDKDKGPNKGDILNGAVSWTRDLMWMLNEKVRREEELKVLIEKLGGTWPYQYNEEEQRMRSELIKAVDVNGTESFTYSRGHGSGLRVPGHTNVAGEPLDGSPNALSPGFQSGGSGSNSGQPQYWPDDNNRGSFSLKEEDEFGTMELS
ncbi:hypothetical protein EJ05DRAFT_190210 [Pseudovirgaria hyperparasitica]|uniref:BHLH domain-containing protein n=1 Tax=Pseudovirgaria hyperparasitica TaxID=470096 RepID=A0A6A6WJZ0_9PEZI|nr:uncharacterized protein EJ05DRAFT_190210 [Pseudovirgaria hyperparasitica]KAF2761951.1 hypothetical protein EJ05DRAFT_190210 [Pseudovirgaria hyperparasitica]